MDASIKLGISACLLGEPVRYDGGHRLDRYLRDVVGPFVEWIPVCPEAECGLPIPREAMHLVGHPDNPRLITIRTGIDHTDRMRKWIAGRLPELEKEDLCGFIFKARSPSSGMRDAKIYTEQGQPSRKGAGIFASAFMERFPDIPVEDEGRLHDAGIRENFIERVFVYHRWKMLLKQGMRMRHLVDFHTDHKLLIMAHSPKLLRELGKYAAQKQGKDSSLLFTEYFRTLMEALRLKATVKKHVNVLYHMMGYFKKVLTSDEKQELIEIIEHYHQGLLHSSSPSHYSIITSANTTSRTSDDRFTSIPIL